MPIDADTAATVAARHGLSLADAAGLLNLADTPDDADRIAARFANGNEAASRDVVRQLFTDTPDRIVSRLSDSEDS
jgi:hypothetical protein